MIKSILDLLSLSFLLIVCNFSSLIAQESKVKIGIGAIMSGDMAVYGQGDYNAAKTYLKNHGRHKIDLIVEDARLTSLEGLQAYQKLVTVDQADVIIAAGTSNGIMAAASLFNKNQVVTLAASTGGKNVDQAGPWLFRIGNSDVLNGEQQAERFNLDQVKKVALLTELTEYTVDISDAFKAKFIAQGGQLVYDQSFLPNTNDFRSQITQIIKSKPQALFMPTQTGTALGVLLKQLQSQINQNEKFEIHTTMVAAHNPDAHKIAGAAIHGVKFMDPKYAKEDRKLKEFLEEYKKEYNSEPAAIFHVASVVDSIELVQLYLDRYKSFDNQKFKEFLEKELGEFCGLLGCFKIDQDGNSNVGFMSGVIP